MTDVTNANDDANASPSVSDELVDPPPEGVDTRPIPPLDLPVGETACQRVHDGPLPESSEDLVLLLAEAFGEVIGDVIGGPVGSETADEIADDMAEKVERFRAALYRLVELARLGA